MISFYFNILCLAWEPLTTADVTMANVSAANVSTAECDYGECELRRM